MAGALLRSGSLSDFHPLGAVGKPVYSAASQLRATIRRLYGQEMADLFAIPKRHDQGDVIDWYAPQSGSVVPWSAATPDERKEALAAIESAKLRLLAESQALQANTETSAERKVFGRLLEQATRIPGEEHIYLVGGRPVMTFWGFHPLGAASSFDVIAKLAAGTAAAAPIVAKEESLPAAEAEALAPVAAAEASERAIDEPSPRRGWWWWLLLPLLLLLLLLLLFGLKSCGVPVPYADWMPALHKDAGTLLPPGIVVPPGLKPVLDAQGRPVIRSDGSAVFVDATGSAIAVYPDGRQVPLGADALPGVPATPPDAGRPQDALPPPGTAAPEPGRPDAPKPPADTPVPPEAAQPPASDKQSGETGKPPEAPPSGDGAKQPPPVTPPSPTPPPGSQSNAGKAGAGAPGTPLSIPPAAVRDGSTGFLDGAWRSITGLQDKAGNPVDLSYQFSKGEGPVTLRRSVGGQQQTCTGAVGSAMQGGQLTINQGEVRCPDGTVFQKSRVVCTPGSDGQANCQGINENGSTYDVDIVK